PTPMPYLPDGVAAIVRNKVTLDHGGHITGNVYLDKSAERLEIRDSGNNFLGEVYKHESRTNDIIVDQRIGHNIEVKDYGYSFDWEKLDDFFNYFPVAPSLDLHEDISVEGYSEGEELDIIKDGNLTITTNPLVTNY